MKAEYEKVYPSPGLPFCFQKRIGRKLYFNWHYHHEYEITLILSGKGQFFVGSNVYNYENMNMILVGPDVPHAFASDISLPSTSSVSVIIQFSRSRIGLEHPSRIDFLPVYRLFKNAGGGIQFSRETAVEVMRVVEPLEADSGLPGLIDLLRIIDLLTKDDDSKILYTNPVPSDLSSKELSMVEKVRHFVFQNFYGDISLSDAAGIANLSVPSFCRFFRKTLIQLL